MNESTVESRQLWMYPGPCDVPHRHLRERGEQIEAGHGKQWFRDYFDVTEELARLISCPGGVFVLPGNAHLGIEIALKNMTPPNGRVLTVENGHWGRRLAEIAESMGFRVSRLAFAEGEEVSLEEVRQAFAQNHWDIVTLVHGESSTGVLNDLAGIAEMCSAASTGLVVDAVATAGAVPVDCPASLNCGLIFSVAKAVGSECGLVVIGLSERTSNTLKERVHKVGYFSDLRRWQALASAPDMMVPTVGSISVSQFRVLAAAVHAWSAEGSTQRFSRHEVTSRFLRSELRQRGFVTIGDSSPLPTITAARVPSGLPASRLVAELARDRVFVDTGIGDQADQIIRIGHMASNADTDIAHAFFERLDRVLTRLGGDGSNGTRESSTA